MNSLPLFCLDTHAIYWRRIASPKLSAAADQVFEDGVQGKAILIVPYVVVAELFYLLQKHGQVNLFAPLLADLQTLPYYHLEPLALSDLASLNSTALC
jgi:PIN domain nuclease of toxin-antitoxin system